MAKRVIFSIKVACDPNVIEAAFKIANREFCGNVQSVHNDYLTVYDMNKRPHRLHFWGQGRTVHVEETEL